MKRDPQLNPTDDTDAELSALFAAMRHDRAPADLEARLLQGLAATSATAAGAATAKLGLWHKVALLLHAHGVATSAIIGGLCGVLACGIYVVVEGSAPARNVTPSVAAPAAPAPDRAPDAPGRAAPPGGDNDAAKRSSEQRRAPTEAPARAPDKPIAPPAGAVVGAASSSSASPPDPAATPAAPVSVEVDAGIGSPPREPSDLLRKELLLVRGIATLVDAGRCAEARAAIAQYRAEHAAGQLAGEVDVLAARCQGR